jgi:hypothetical protein
VSPFFYNLAVFLALLTAAVLFSLTIKIYKPYLIKLITVLFDEKGSQNYYKIDINIIIN